MCSSFYLLQWVYFFTTFFFFFNLQFVGLVFPVWFVQLFLVKIEQQRWFLIECRRWLPKLLFSSFFLIFSFGLSNSSFLYHSIPHSLHSLDQWLQRCHGTMVGMLQGHDQLDHGFGSWGLGGLISYAIPIKAEFLDIGQWNNGKLILMLWARIYLFLIALLVVCSFFFCLIFESMSFTASLFSLLVNLQNNHLYIYIYI